MSGRISLIWDYDTAIGQVNATYPYKFHEENLVAEIEAMDRLLDTAAAREVPMTFACVGFAAEPGHFPYHVPEQIRRIFEAGHEVASHSWRHEWFPYLEEEQIRRSLARSKATLEACCGQEGIVRGFVPPFSRPMSWRAKGALSLGDRAFGKRFPGADLGSLLKIVAETGYRWCRVTYRPLWRKFLPYREPMPRRVRQEGTVTCLPLHATGFDDRARELLAHAVENGRDLVICGHPAALLRQGPERFDLLEPFLDELCGHRSEGRLEIVRAQDLCEPASREGVR